MTNISTLDNYELVRPRIKYEDLTFINFKAFNKIQLNPFLSRFLAEFNILIFGQIKSQNFEIFSQNVMTGGVIGLLLLLLP